MKVLGRKNIDLGSGDSSILKRIRLITQHFMPRSTTARRRSSRRKSSPPTASSTAGSTTPSEFEKIPIELLERIFLYLGIQDILRCQSVCRKWNDVITQSNELQYHIALKQYGYEDHAYASQSTPVRLRLEELRHLEDAWLRLNDTLKDRERSDPITVAVPIWRTWSVFDNVDIKLVGDTLISLDNQGVLAVLHLSRGGSDQDLKLMHCDLGEASLNPALDNALGVDYDPDQNVLAVVIFDENIDMYLHVLSLEEDGSDNLSVKQRSPAVSMGNLAEYSETPYVYVTISGDYIIAACPYDVEPHTYHQILIYQWTTEKVIKRLNSSLDVHYKGAAIICNKFLFLLRHDLRNPPLLDRQPPPKASFTSLHLDVHPIIEGKIDFRYNTIFEFPPLKRRGSALFEVIWSRPDTMRVWSRGQRTELSPAEVMIHFNIFHGELEQETSFVSPLSTFVDLDMPPTRSRKSYAWSMWGPKNTHFCQSSTLSKMVHVCGYHAILPQGEVLDFNPASAGKFKAGKLLPQRAKLIESGCHPIKQTAIFVDKKVQTSLPYIVYPAPAVRLYHLEEEEDKGYWREFFTQDSMRIKMIRLRYDEGNHGNIRYIDVCML